MGVVDTCYNLTSTPPPPLLPLGYRPAPAQAGAKAEQRVLFFNKFNNKGGIYLIQYKDDLNIYYIGRAKNFKNRLNINLKTKVTDKFHLFANLVGWAKFNFSII